MNHDDGMRSRIGVVACLRKTERGDLRLIFDDVTTTNPRHPADWQTRVMFTYDDYDMDHMSSLNLSQEDYAMIGENLVIRLLALEGMLSNT